MHALQRAHLRELRTSGGTTQLSADADQGRDAPAQMTIVWPVTIAPVGSSR